MLYGGRRRGRRLNGRRIHTSKVTALGDALACTGFPAAVQPDSPDLLVFKEAVFCCQSVRRMGSASLNLCYLAAGRFDVLWSFATKIWDVAAGCLFVAEAGGIVTAPEGGPFVLEEARYIAAANPTLHAQFSSSSPAFWADPPLPEGEGTAAAVSVLYLSWGSK